MINREQFLHFAAPKGETGKPVFISYSHQDQEWLQVVEFRDERGLVVSADIHADLLAKSVDIRLAIGKP